MENNTFSRFKMRERKARKIEKRKLVSSYSLQVDQRKSVGGGSGNLGAVLSRNTVDINKSIKRK